MYKYIFVFATAFAFSFAKIYAQNYSVVSITDSLKDGANCVVRDYTKEIELQSINSKVERIKKVITVLDKEGENMAYLLVPYDKNSTVNIEKILLYDRNGKQIRKVKQSEIEDSPGYSEYTLYSDNRIKFFKPDYAEYPYSIEYDYVIVSTNNISYGCWSPIDKYNISVEHARLTLRYPIDIKINKKEINTPVQSSGILKNNIMFMTWDLNNLRALEKEPFDISAAERVPCIYLMPAELVYDNYKGAVNDWCDYGKWINNLFNGRDELSDMEKLKVKTLLKNISDTLELVKTLYKYMQENTRYVFIKLGIGGFQPFDAKTVSATGYGDCKALSNYMHSLLKFAGIKSYPTLVSSGRYIVPIFTDFPNFQQFDHVILCVPFKKDTTWLECTNQKIPFGFLGDNTDDRDVLLITENGGKFAHTKRYDSEDNLRICSSYFDIDPNGMATCSIKTGYHGLQYDDIFELLCLSYDEQKKWLYNYSTLPSVQISAFSINDNKKPLPVATINESLISKNYCSFSGSYIILPLNLINSQKPIQKMLKSRLSDVIIERSYIDYDTLVYKIPPNFKFESVPSEKFINSKFGNYSYSIKINGNKIFYIRTFSINQGRYKPSEYKDLYEFILSVSKADNIKVILTKGA